MTSPIVQTTNDENMAAMKSTAVAPPTSIQTRRVLGDVSPNVKNTISAVTHLKNKPMAGSPLKRSFTAMMEDGKGFTYMKKRRLSVDRPLSHVEEPRSFTRSVFESTEVPAAVDARFRPISLSPPADEVCSTKPTN